jgi:Tfp pilus assembly protein PilN
MVNAGLALKGQLPGGSGNLYSMIDFNALPQAYQPPAFSWMRVVMPVGAVAAALVLVYGALALTSLRNETSSLTKQYNDLLVQTAKLRSDNSKAQDAITAEQAQSTTLSTQADGVQSQITLAQQNATLFNNTLGGLKTALDDCDRDVREIVNDAPSGVNITDIEYQTDSITIKGIAPSQSIVLTYARALRSGARFTLVTVSSIETLPDGTLGFNFVLS